MRRITISLMIFVFFLITLGCNRKQEPFFINPSITYEAEMGTVLSSEDAFLMDVISPEVPLKDLNMPEYALEEIQGRIMALQREDHGLSEGSFILNSIPYETIRDEFPGGVLRKSRAETDNPEIEAFYYSVHKIQEGGYFYISWFKQGIEYSKARGEYDFWGSSPAYLKKLYSLGDRRAYCVNFQSQVK